MHRPARTLLSLLLVFLSLDVMASAPEVRSRAVAVNSFPRAGVLGITVRGLNGNDSIVVDAAVAIPAYLQGGNGRDLLTGGSGNDNIDGGNGRDTIAGGAQQATVIVMAGRVQCRSFITNRIRRNVHDGKAVRQDRVRGACAAEVNEAKGDGRRGDARAPARRGAGDRADPGRPHHSGRHPSDHLGGDGGVQR